MFYSTMITADMTRELTEEELDSLVKDLWSFKTSARVVGKIRNMPNYMYNIYNETEYNEVSNKFGGRVSVYVEHNGREDVPVDDICSIFSKYDFTVVSLIRKFKL